MIATAQEVDIEQMKAIFSQQKKMAIQLRTSSIADRQKKLKQIKAWIGQNENDIYEALKLDFKKSETETLLSEIMPVVAEINYVTKHLKSWARPSTVPVPLMFLGTSNKLYREPKGVSLIIAPWNYPFHLSIKPLVSAIAAGCTAIIKPSELTPNTSKLIDRMVSEIFDEGYCKVFQGEAEVAIALQKLPFDHIFFTGSPQVGKMVMKAASQHLTSVTLELGGKSPAIVDKDASLERAAKVLMHGKFLNAGQTCVSPDYTIVHEDVVEQFIKQLKELSNKMANNEDYENVGDYCRIINSKHHKRITDLLQDAEAKGAQIVHGGHADTTDNFLSPTIISGANDSMEIMQEEIFGPVLPIITYHKLEEVSEYINKKEKPLALYIFTKSKRTEDFIIKNTSSGAVLVNEALISTIYKGMPFGGVNNSGIGKTGGEFGFMEFTNLKPYIKNHFAATSLFHPPYTKFTHKVSKVLTQYLT